MKKEIITILILATSLAHGTGLKAPSLKQIPNTNLKAAGKTIGNFKSYSGSEGVGGGDEVALEFQKAFSVALKNLKTHNSEVFQKISAAKLMEKAASSKVIVVDDALDITVKEIIQNSIATNTRSTNTILINRSRWNAINDNWLKEGIALHEIASLAGLEQTGYYPISSTYVSLMGGSSTSLNTNLSVDVLKQVTAQNPRANPKEVLKKIYDESSVPASINDFDLTTDRTSRQECQGIGFPDTEGLSPVMVRRAIITTRDAVPDRGPLFPGQAAMREPVLVFAILPQQFNSLLNDPTLPEEVWGHGASSISKTTTELIVKTRFTSQGQKNAIENGLLAKRSGNLLVIKMYGKSLLPAELEVDSTPKYIYCYRH